MHQIISFLRFLEHPISKKSYFSAIKRLLSWLYLSRTRKEIIADFVPPAKLSLKKGLYGASSNYYFGLSDYQEMGFLLHYLSPGDFFVDIGANAGVYSVLASKVCGAKSMAFEPIPETQEYLLPAG